MNSVLNTPMGSLINRGTLHKFYFINISYLFVPFPLFQLYCSYSIVRISLFLFHCFYYIVPIPLFLLHCSYYIIPLPLFLFHYTLLHYSGSTVPINYSSPYSCSIIQWLHYFYIFRDCTYSCWIYPDLLWIAPTPEPPTLVYSLIDIDQKTCVIQQSC